MRLTLILVLAATASSVAAQDVDNTIVDTHYGKVQGDTDLSRGGKMFYQFKNIPYAKAPERFQSPEIPDHWEGIKNATEFGNKCPQYEPISKTFIGEEDCLNLNIFSPNLPTEGEDQILLPVVVTLHPGGHSHGSGKVYGPKYFMDENVVMVSLNSRLGPFGFLNIGHMYAQGNMGIKDQSLALRWVNLNIEKFGGDKGRVTMLGFSAGAAETLLHLVNPLSKGLIHGAVVQSGSPLSPCSMIRDPISQAKKLGEQVGCPIDNGENLVMCLKGMDHLEILKKMKIPDPEKEGSDLGEIARFGPSVEQVLEGQTEADVVLSDSPHKLLITEEKVVNKVPLILGATDSDGLLPFVAKIVNSTEKLAKLGNNWTDFGPIVLDFKSSAKDPALVAKKLWDFYVGEGKTLDGKTLIKMFTDRYFASTTRYTAKQFSKYASVYPYYFSHNPEHHIILDGFGYPNITSGAAHLDDMQYLFNGNDDLKYPEITEEHSTEAEYKLSTGLVKLWASFFETGKPTKTWGEAKEWKKLEDPAKPNFYSIGVETKNIESEPEEFLKRMELWSELYREGGQLNAELETPIPEKF